MTTKLTRCALLLALALPAAARAEEPPTVAQLAWLAGCWAYVGAEPGSGETWMPPAGGSLLAVARTVRGGRTVAHELLRIVEEDGSLALHAAPSGQAGARFALESITANEVVFANPEHDFPQRITYRLAQDGSISARVEGARDDPGRAADFPMRRTSCERSAR
jgi:hypothetical protein